MSLSRRLRALLLLTLGLSLCAQAQQDPAEAARQLGAAGNQQAEGATSTTPESYTVYQGSNPDNVQQYYSSGSSIQTQAQQTLAAAPPSDPANTAVSQAVAGPQFSFASNNPMLTQGQTIATQATALTQTYQGCQALSVGQPSTAPSPTAICTVNVTSATESCTDQRVTSCPANAPTTAGIADGSLTSNAAFSYAFPILTIGTAGDNTLAGNCVIYTQTTTFQVTPALLKTFMLTYAGYDDYLQILVDGQQVFNGPYGGDMLAIVGNAVQYSTSGKTGACELATNWRTPLAIDLRPYLGTSATPTSVTITTNAAVGGGGEDWSTYDIENYPDCSSNDQWNETCSASISGCVLESQVCTDGPGTKVVDGTTQYRDCWAYANTYLCDSSQEQLQAGCAQYFNQGCTQTGSVCQSTGSDGQCTQYQQTFSCPTASSGSNSVTLCGSDLYCQGGSCTSDLSTYTPSTVTDLAQSSAYLQAAQDAASDNTNSTGTISFFLGQGMQCSQAAVGYSNCCTDSGWGSSAGLTECTSEEETLGLARQAGQTHFIGTYSTGSLVLKTTYQAYCVFNSMLSRIIQEQGRQQLGIAWGTPQSPDCRAFTQTEMESLDFNAMDFSEFYAYAEAQANASMAGMPTNAAIEQQLQQQITQMQQNPGISDGTSSTGP